MEFEERRYRIDCPFACVFFVLLVGMVAPASSRSAQNAQGKWFETSNEVKTGVYSLHSNGNSLFAGTDLQGAYRTADRGSSWQSITTGLSSKLNIYAFFEFSGRLLAGTSDGVFYSEDTGKTWAATNHERWRELHVLAMASHGSFLFATSNREFKYPYNGGLMRSSDSGKSWFPVNNGFTAKYWISTMVAHQGSIYVGTSGEGLYRTDDDGETWAAFNPGLPKDLSSLDTRRLFSWQERLYLGTSDGVYVLSRNGNSWNQSNAGLPENFLVTSFAAAGDYLFIGSSSTFGGGVFYSTDRGVSWKGIDPPKEGPLKVASMVVMGDDLYVGTGANICGELGCNGSEGGVWKMSLPQLLGVQPVSMHHPRRAARLRSTEKAVELDALGRSKSLR